MKMQWNTEICATVYGKSRNARKLPSYGEEDKDVIAMAMEGDGCGSPSLLYPRRQIELGEIIFISKWRRATAGLRFCPVF